MGTPNQFNDIIKKHLNVYAAWVPILNKFQLGDYGIMSNGVFQKLGNITEEFEGIEIKEGVGEEVSLNFTSEGTRARQFAGGAQVDVIPASDIEAKVEFEFTREKSFLIQAPSITVVTIDNVRQVAKALIKSGEWDGKWKVVHQVLRAEDAVIVCANDAGTKINFDGKASAFKNMKLGNLGLNFDTNKVLGLDIKGKTGVIGLALFRLKSKIFGGFKLDMRAAIPEEGNDEPIFIDANEDLEDDL